MTADINGIENGKSHTWRDTSGRFQPGNPGRQKGSVKSKLRDEIKTFITTEWPNFKTWFNTLKEEKKIEVLLNLLPYGVSRLQSISMSDDEGEPIEKGIDLSRWSDDDLRILIGLQKKYGNGTAV